MLKLALIWLGSSTVEQGLHKTTVAGPNPAPATNLINKSHNIHLCAKIVPT
jgi:hypothetical protein